MNLVQEKVMNILEFPFLCLSFEFQVFVIIVMQYPESREYKRENLLALISIITISGIVKCKSNECKSLESVGCLEQNTKYTQNLIQKGIVDTSQANFEEHSRLITKGHLLICD